MRLLILCLALTAFAASLVCAEVFWFEAENYDLDKSNPVFNEQGINVTWETKEDTNQEIRDDDISFGGMYVTSNGGNRDIIAGAAGLAYILPEVENAANWKLWIRSKMPTSGSDSFFYQFSKDGGDTWRPPDPIEAHGGAQWTAWEWHRPWDITLAAGGGNAIRIAERESGAKFDVICLRNDGQTPTDEEYQAYLDSLEDIAVHAKGKLVDTWGRVKSHVILDR
ncbi:hypothetical protein ACFL6S_19880 [Candidatus Poribacteria bacterium]